jgi:predicted nucleotidyltransferase
MFEQDRVIMRLQQRVLTKSDILTCFLSGSFGRRTQDAYSDLDVALVFADLETREAAWQERRDFVQSVLPYVAAKSFDADHVRPYFHIALYSNGAKVDYRYETPETLSPNSWDRHMRILKDSDSWGETFQADSAQAFRPQPQISAEELTRLDNRFWIMF